MTSIRFTDNMAAPYCLYGPPCIPSVPLLGPARTCARGTPAVGDWC